VAEWIAYYLLDLYVTGSNPGGESFPTLISLNYSLTVTQANEANRPFGVDKLATAGADRGQSLFAYHPILSTLGYNFKTVVNFQDEGKLWYYFLALFNLEEMCPYNLSKTSASAGTMNLE